MTTPSSPTTSPVLSDSGLPATPTEASTTDAGTPVALALIDPPETARVAEDLPFRLRVEDAQARPVAGFRGTLRVSSTDEAAEGLGEFTVETDAEGGFELTLQMGTLGPQEVRFEEVALGLAVTHPLTVSAGVPESLTSRVEVDPERAIADGETPVAVQVRVRDAAGNPVPGVDVRLLTGEESDVLDPEEGVTDAEGVFRSALIASLSGDRIVRAIVDGGRFTLAAGLRLDGSAPSPTLSNIVVTPHPLFTDGQDEAVVTVTVLDLEGQPSAGRRLRLSSSFPSDVLGAEEGVTGADGRFETTLRVVEVGERVLEATLLPGGLSFARTVTVRRLPPDPGRTTFTISPSSLLADGTSRATLRIAVQNENGERIPGVPINLQSNRSEDIFTPPVGFANENGFFEATLQSTRGGTAEIRAVIDNGAFTLVRNVFFTADGPSEEFSGFFAGPSPLVADGVATMTLSVVVRDDTNTPLANIPVSFSSSEPSDVFSQTSGVTSGAGSLVVRMSATVVGERELQAEFANGLFTLSRTVRFRAGAADPSRSMLAARPAVGTAGPAALPVVIEFLALDAFDNPVPEAAVTFTVSEGEIIAGGLRTRSDGTLEAALRSNAVADVEVSASVEGVALEETLVVPFVSTFAFTNCGARGAFGPEAGDCDADYAGTALEERVDLEGGVQVWRVPATGLWRIEAVGAQGASAEPLREGGRGARMASEVELSGGDFLRVIVGQMGEVDEGGSAGGGGASVVSRQGPTPTPLLIAAGGGGVAAGAERDGCPGRAGGVGSGGSGSEAGASFACAPRDLQGPSFGGGISAAGTGAGGGALNDDGEADEAGGGAGGSALQGAATGGLLLSAEGEGPCGGPADGGFGGGGSGRGCPGAGGGGGWTGGDGGRVAGGGGSWSGTTPVDQEGGVGEGAGRVVISRVE